MSEQGKAKRWFKSAKSLYQTRAPKILLWGPWATGKTYFLGTCPPPVYIFDPELGATSVMNHNFKKLVDEEQIFIAEVGVVDDKTHEINPGKTLKNFEEAMVELLPMIGNKGTLAIDSGTVVWQILGWWLDDLKDKGQLKMAKGQMMRTEWSRANRRFYNWIMQLVNRKELVVVLTSHTQDIYNESGDMTVPDGKMRINKQTPYWVDFVYHLERKTKYEQVGKGTSRRTTTSKERIATLEKCRFADAMLFTEEERRIKDLTYPKMVEQLKGLGLIFSEDGTIDKPKQETKEALSGWRKNK